MEFPNHIPFAQALGFELITFEGGHSELALTLTPEQLNSGGMAHGGLLMTLLDVAMAHAARSQFKLQADAPPGTRPDSVATIEMKTSFMRPGLGRLTASANVLTQTLTMSFCEGSILGADGKLVAHATATFKRLRPKPVSNPA